MPRFALIYRGGKGFKTPENGKAHMAKWRAWTATLGGSYIYPGMPFSTAKTIDRGGVSDGSGTVPVTGVSVIEAETMEGALEMAKNCPHLEIGGDIVVAQGMDMEM